MYIGEFDEATMIQSNCTPHQVALQIVQNEIKKLAPGRNPHSGTNSALSRANTMESILTDPQSPCFNCALLTACRSGPTIGCSGIGVAPSDVVGRRQSGEFLHELSCGQKQPISEAHKSITFRDTDTTMYLVAPEG